MKKQSNMLVVCRDFAVWPFSFKKNRVGVVAFIGISWHWFHIKICQLVGIFHHVQNTGEETKTLGNNHNRLVWSEWTHCIHHQKNSHPSNVKTWPRPLSSLKICCRFISNDCEWINWKSSKWIWMSNHPKRWTSGLYTTSRFLFGRTTLVCCNFQCWVGTELAPNPHDVGY